MTRLWPNASEQTVTTHDIVVAIVPNNTSHPSAWGVIVWEPNGDLHQLPMVISYDIAKKAYNHIIAELYKGRTDLTG